MGRGRAKAKQTKVARELKYSSPTTDLEALQRELSGDTGRSQREVGGQLPEDERTEETCLDDYDEYRR